MLPASISRSTSIENDYKYGGVYRTPQAVLENVFTKIPVDFDRARRP